MRQSASAVLSTLCLLAACADAPQPTSPLTAAQPEVGIAMSLVDVLAARGPSPLRPRTGGATTLLTVVPDPGDPNTETHTFDELPQNCFFDAVLSDPYEGLDFLTTPYLAACFSPNGTIAVVPSSSSAFGGSVAYEVRMQLAFPASAASIEVFDFTGQPIQLNGYDANGVLVAQTSVPAPFGTWATITLTSSTNFRQLGINMHQANTYIDNLKITYKKDPTDKDQCKDGGWVAFGFKNQGQCVRFVETGKDSRTA